jgi:hypothetical protein
MVVVVAVMWEVCNLLKWEGHLLMWECTIYQLIGCQVLPQEGAPTNQIEDYPCFIPRNKSHPLTIAK